MAHRRARSPPLASPAPPPRHCPPRENAAASASTAPRPCQVVGTPQPGKVTLDLADTALATVFQQRPLQTAQVALAPAGGKDADLATVKVNQPAAAIGIDQDVVGVQISMVQTGTMEARNHPPHCFPRCALAGDLCALGQRAHPFQTLHQDRRAVADARTQVHRSDHLRHRQALRVQMPQQTELGKTARALGTGPDIAGSTQARYQSATPVVPQHTRAERRIDEPGTAPPTIADGTGTPGPELRVKQRCLDLSQLLPVKHNGTVASPLAARRHCFIGVESDHSIESNNTMPQSSSPLCLLRLSALGDVTHVVPLVRTLQRANPQQPLHWIIDKAGHKLLEGLPGVHFHTDDPKTGLAGMRALRRQLMPHAPFAALLQLQVSLRANVLSAFIPARRRIGYDKSRSKELHGLFVNERIPAHAGGHVLDAIGRFSQPLGITQTAVQWDLATP